MAWERGYGQLEPAASRLLRGHGLLLGGQNQDSRMRAFPLLRLFASRFTVRHAHGPESGRMAKYASHTLERCENKAGRLFQQPASGHVRRRAPDSPYSRGGNSSPRPDRFPPAQRSRRVGSRPTVPPQPRHHGWVCRRAPGLARNS